MNAQTNIFLAESSVSTSLNTQRNVKARKGESSKPRMEETQKAKCRTRESRNRKNSGSSNMLFSNSVVYIFCYSINQLVNQSINQKGSITHITNASGTIVQELSYDAWGRLRDPTTQIPYTPGNEPELFLGRGYTGHEHLTQFGLINMNARLYDPAVGRFLSADSYVPNPFNSQDFNRYSYARNNPMCYIDPSGEVVWFVPILIGVGVAVLIDYGSQVVVNYLEHRSDPNYSNKDMLLLDIDWFDVAIAGIGGGLSVAFPAAAPYILYGTPFVTNAFNLKGDGRFEVVGRDFKFSDYIIKSGIDVASIAATKLIKDVVIKTPEPKNRRFKSPPKPKTLKEKYSDYSFMDVLNEALGGSLWDFGSTTAGSFSKLGWDQKYENMLNQQNQPPLQLNIHGIDPKSIISENPYFYKNNIINLSKYLRLSR